MKKVVYIFLIALMTVTSCQQKKTEKSPEVIDTIPVMVMQVQKCSRLYTAEAHVHKIITMMTNSICKGHSSRRHSVSMYLVPIAR